MSCGFWVLENSVHQYLMTHTGDCGFCKCGQGPRAEHTGKWHGPYLQYSDAQQYMLHVIQGLGGQWHLGGKDQHGVHAGCVTPYMETLAP